MNSKEGLKEICRNLVKKPSSAIGSKRYIDRRKKHGKCRFDIKQPTGRFCTYWNQKLDDKTCHKCESKE